jgi:hypothetical protein
MTDAKKSMPYGQPILRYLDIKALTCCAVRLGKSGLKVSKIILGCMSYGTPEWQGWVLEEEESIKHIKAAYVT